MAYSGFSCKKINSRFRKKNVLHNTSFSVAVLIVLK